MSTQSNAPSWRTFCSNLRTARRYRELTQEQLADRLKLSKRTIQRVESGESPYSESIVAGVCKVLDLSPTLMLEHNLVVCELLVPTASLGRHCGAMVHDNLANLLTLERKTTP